MRTYALYEHAGHVPYGVWESLGIKGVLFDKDGTLQAITNLSRCSMLYVVFEKGWLEPNFL